MVEQQLGELQHLIMLAVARVQDRAFGASIQRELREVAGRKVTLGTIYVTLTRLEKQGLVESNYATEAPSRKGGRPRRYFSLTHSGWLALRRSRKALVQMWNGVEEPAR